MDASSGQTQQEMSSDSVGNMLVAGPKAGGNQPQTQQDQRKPRPHPEQALKCPRCDSTNTKFCYYNNYSLTQPRYFCKACRRYWTKGGTLRNVPVGGGCRKNRRSSSSSSSSSSSASASKRAPQDLHAPIMHPNLIGANFPLPPFLGGGGAGGGGCYDQNDLALAFARLQKSSCGGGAEQLAGFDPSPQHQLSSVFGHGGSAGFLDALRSGFIDQSAQNGGSAEGAFPSLYYGFCGSNSNSGGNVGDGSENSTPTAVGVSGGSEHDRINVGMGYDHDHDQISNATTTAVTVTTIKQELGHGMRGHHDHDDHDHDHQSNRMLWGCPWQMNGSDHHGIASGNMSDFDGSATGRDSWTGLASSWQGLLNTTPLM